MTLFKDFFVAFDLDKSSPTDVYCGAAYEASYYIHLCSEARTSILNVDFSVTPGDGLKEGVDYEVTTKGRTISFYPGVYDKPINIKWLKHDIDADKDCSLRLQIESVSDGNISIGMGGPAKRNNNLLLIKYNQL